MDVQIAIPVGKAEIFEKQFPVAVYMRKDGRIANIYSMPRHIYEREYKRTDKTTYAIYPPTTNYVKITGTVSGQPVKLFVKETHVYKVLDKISKVDGQWKQDCQSTSISMRKVQLPNTMKKRIEPILLKSLAAVGIAA
jgi:hypothetical protein